MHCGQGQARLRVMAPAHQTCLSEGSVCGCLAQPRGTAWCDSGSMDAGCVIAVPQSLLPLVHLVWYTWERAARSSHSAGT
jgi:hypothetical protein